MTAYSSSAGQQAHHLRADMMLVVVTLVAALGWIFSKEALNGFPPLMFMGLRFLIAGLILAVPGYRALRRLRAHEWRTSAVVGLVFGAAMSFWITGLSQSSALGEGAFINSLSVVMVPLISMLLFAEKPALSVWLALPVAIAGLALLSLQHGFNPAPGQMYFLASALLFSLMLILNGRAASRIPALALSSIQLVVVGLMACVLSLLLEDLPQQSGVAMWVWLGLSITIGTSARFLLQTYAQGLTTPSHAAVIMILEPVWTALLASVWFDEHMSAIQITGCSLILASLLINRWQAVSGWLLRR
ncbi:MAG: DMT family transporter [Pseudomonadota bacterium]|nr:DMT family transporter [Pseudomonadota bacterium]